MVNNRIFNAQSGFKGPIYVKSQTFYEEYAKLFELKG